jgi:hypothetical protein
MACSSETHFIMNSKASLSLNLIKHQAIKSFEGVEVVTVRLLHR